MPGISSLLLVPLTVLSVQDRTELRVRSGAESGEAALDLSNTPSISLGVRGSRRELTLNLRPTVAWVGLNTEASAFAPYLELDSTFIDSYQKSFLMFRESAQLGQANLRLQLAPLPSGGAAIDPDREPATPPASPGATQSQGRVVDRFVTFGASRTALTLGQSLTKRVGIFESVGYGIRGSFDEPPGEDATYPLQTEWLLGVGLGYSTGQNTTWTTSLGAQRVTTSGFEDVYLLGLEQGLRQVFSRTVRGQFHLGIAGSMRDAEDAAERTPLFTPTAGARLNVDLSERTSLLGALVFSPVVDQFTGNVDQRVSTNWGISYAGQRLSLAAATDATLSVQTERAETLFLTGVSGLVSYRLTDRWFIDGRAQTSFQAFAAQAADPFYGGALGLTYSPPRLLP